MVETITKRRAVLTEIYETGDFGEITDQPGVTFRARNDLSMVQIAGWEDKVDVLIAALEESIGLKIDNTPSKSSSSNTTSSLWLGPERWLIVEKETSDLEAVIRSAISEEIAAITDQSHSRSVLRVEGPEVRNVLRKGTLLDLDEGYFNPGEVRTTSLFHMNAIIHCLENDQFDIYVSRSFGQSFFEVITHAAAEYGYRVEESL